MSDARVHVVFLFPAAIEALGEAIKPYLSEGPFGRHILCHEIDSGGAFFQMTIQGTTGDGRSVELQLMLPSNMVQMVISTQGDSAFGFGRAVETAHAPATAGRAAASASAVQAMAAVSSAVGDSGSSPEG
ncbi:MAG: hypothetical protein JSS44_06490 [Proteobacteria bacterium]|nr:hypothetical protein [Pseudomonadota bacterium]MBS0461334.1 hypothetical protein [Pseudomonadota bacterium]